MTQDEIIRMAREAGFEGLIEKAWGIEQLERFAALVAAHEREKQTEQKTVAWMDAIGNIHKQKLQRDWIPLYVSTQAMKQKPVVWKNTVDEVRFKEPVNSCQKSTELVDIEAAVLVEREACAKVCEERGHCNECGGGEQFAAAIRARGDHGN